MKKRVVLRLSLMAVLMLSLAVSAPGWAQDGDVCNGMTCENLDKEICSPGGFKISLTKYVPANLSPDGTATYEYKICNPSKGTCVSEVRQGESCLDNSFCQSNGENTDSIAYCMRECAVDTFSYLTHFDVTFPEPGNSCLGESTVVTGDCVCSPTDPEACSVDQFIDLGDASCFGMDYPVAKCDIIRMAPGYCIIMTVEIAGENPGLGLGPAVLVGATDTACTASCLPGPSCAICEEDGPACLVRTIGFWGTHPHITGSYVPVTVCEVDLLDTKAGTCSTSEALCTNANDHKQSPPYLSLVAQLTGAKLNLNATRQLFGGSCNTWEYQGKSIQEWIKYCETNYCSASKQDIGRSGCIEALTAFNESKDTGFDVTPPPFDRPGPADPSQCQDARGNGINIGNCAEEAPPADHQKGKK